ncbi:hypothetical protein F5877DRAFT_70455 [Lentinula edodes]|nr:hypothetical protein F5877DRAFT_70455 [Lentinula edodes]
MVKKGIKSQRASRNSIASAQRLPVHVRIADHNDIDLLRDLFMDFKRRTRRGKLVTFMKSIMQWVSWTAPIQQSISGTMTAVCPINYVNMLGYKVKVSWNEENITDLSASLHDSTETIGKNILVWTTTVDCIIIFNSRKGTNSMELVARRKPRIITTGMLESFYSEEKATQRRFPDVDLIEVLRSAFRDGVFRKYPRLHPAYDSQITPILLLQFDPNKTSGSTTFLHLQYYDTIVGKLIKNLNSTIGIKQSMFDNLLMHSQDLLDVDV